MNREGYYNKLEEIQRENLENSKEDHGFYDKSLLYLASGSFVLSVNFLKDVVGGECTLLPWLLITSWSLFTVSILTNLGSYRASQYFNQRRIEAVNEEKESVSDSPYTDEMPDRFYKKINKLADKRTSHVKTFNEIASATFGLAIFAMSVFAIVNVW